MGIMPSPYLKCYEINTGIQSYKVEFKGANKKFSFLEISLVYDKSDQHNNLYYSYDAEIVATFIGTLNIENASNNYSISNEINFDFTNKNDKFLMYRQFVAWYTKGCSVAPLSEYSNQG